MRKIFVNIVCVCLCLLVGMGILTSYANADGLISAQNEVIIIREDTSLRDEFTKFYLCSDGTYMAVAYPDPIHFKQNGEWVDVDNSITATPTGYKNNNSKFPVRFSSTAGDDMVTLDAGENNLSWTVSAIDGTSEIAAGAYNNEGLTVKNNQPKRNSKKVSDPDSVYLPKASGGVQYSNVFGNNHKVNIHYTVMHNKVEEDIILQEKSNITAFCMQVKAGALIAYVNSDNSISFNDLQGNTAYSISPPYMCDANDEVLNAFTVSISQQGENCKITYTPDSQWLNADERSYPILFDPAITTTEYNSGITDTYVLEGDTAVHDTEQKLYAGIKSGKLTRTYIKIRYLPAFPFNMPLLDAELTLRMTNGTTTGRQFSLYKVTSSWTPSSITYANQPSIGSKISTDNFDASSLITSFKLTTDINSLMSSYFSGSNYGYMIRYTSESKTNPDYNAFYSTEFTTKSSRPYIKLIYGNSAPAGLMNNEVYTIKNAATGKFLTVAGGTNANGTNIIQSTADNTSKQKFRLELTDNGAYLLRAMCSSNGTNRVLDVVKSGGYVAIGSNIQLYTNVDPTAQEWLFLPIGNGYRIYPRTNVMFTLTAIGTSNGTASGTGPSDAGNVCLKSYLATQDQIWYFYDSNGTLVTPDSASYLEDGTYYINNKSTGKFAKHSGSSPSMSSGLLANIGSEIKWTVTYLGNDEYIIRPSNEPDKYLCGSTALYNMSVSLISVSGSTEIPLRCKWSIHYQDGIIITNRLTGYVLCDINGTLSAYPASSAGTYKYWRCASTATYGTGSHTLQELGPNFSIQSKIVNKGQSFYPQIIKSPNNATWASYDDFTYSTNYDNLSINSTTGLITANASGKAFVTATHKVTGRSTEFAVFVNLSAYTSSEQTAIRQQFYNNYSENGYFSAISTRQVAQVLDIIFEYDEYITQICNLYQIPKEFVQAILFRELWCFSAEDPIADNLVTAYYEYMESIESGVPAIPPLISNDDSSTGLGQIHAKTAINAWNNANIRGFETLTTPYDIQDWHDMWNMWQNLNSDNYFNIKTCALVLLDCQYYYNAQCPYKYLFDIALSETSAKLILSKYNGTGESAQNYGNHTYQYFVIFQNYN